jgi:Leucine-rich repeat (LRR) protein
MIDRSPLPVSRLARSMCTLLVVLSVSCTDSAPEAPPPPEASFSAQAAAVREGRSEQIRLDTAKVSDEDLKNLAGLEDKLRRINLSHTTIGDRGLAQIAELKQLEQLRLAGPQITDAGVAVLQSLPQLKHLHLIDVPLTDAGLAHLHGLKNLQSLYLDGTRGSEQGMTELVEALPGVHLHFDGGHYREDSHADHPH